MTQRLTHTHTHTQNRSWGTEKCSNLFLLPLCNFLLESLISKTQMKVNCQRSLQNALSRGQPSRKNGHRGGQVRKMDLEWGQVENNLGGFLEVVIPYSDLMYKEVFPRWRWRGQEGKLYQAEFILLKGMFQSGNCNIFTMNTMGGRWWCKKDGVLEAIGGFLHEPHL